MFSPAPSKAGQGRGRDPAPATPPRTGALLPSPARTPAAANQAGGYGASAGPTTPWAVKVSRSVTQSSPDGNLPTLVCDFPRQVRSYADRQVGPRMAPRPRSGGMDQTLGLSWLLQADRLFVWSHMASQAVHDCAELTIPAELLLEVEEDWLLCLVEQQGGGHKKASPAVSVLLCNRKSGAVAYWPQAFGDGYCPEVVVGDAAVDAKARSRENQVSSLVASGADGKSCVAVGSTCSGEVYRLDCSPGRVSRRRIVASSGLSVRALAWLPISVSAADGWRQLLRLTAKGLECWDVQLGGRGIVSCKWRHDLIGDDAGDKEVWLLDLQVDTGGNEVMVLVASCLKDRVNNWEYMQYALLTFVLHGSTKREGVVVSAAAAALPALEKKGSVQVILPRARVEEEGFLHSMRLRTGGRPSGSVMILAGDGTATVAHPSWDGSFRLFQFSVPWDVGKVLDASVVAPLDDGEEGAWLVLTEKAGVWVIPEKVVLSGGVEPPQRNWGSSSTSANEGVSVNEERKGETSGSSESGVVPEPSRETKPPRAALQHRSQDEETEEIVGRLFQHFASTGQVDNALDKLQRARAFDRQGGANVFARTSKAIVDTLGKHWTRGGDVGTSIVSSQFAEKQRQHQQYLNFLATTGCHEELQRNQREALQIIMEHGEKLAAVTKLRELHNVRAQGAGLFSADAEEGRLNGRSGELVGALWDTVQLVGEKIRRSNAVLMNREKAEIFYSRVSEVEDFFGCIEHHGDSIVGREYPSLLQAERLCELADACTISLRAAVQYRDSNQFWYPSSEGLTPWYCGPAVRAGLWKLAIMIMEITSEVATLQPESKQVLVSRLEEVSDIMLDAYGGAVKTKIEHGEEHRGLQSEYGMRRDVLLGALHQHVKEMATLEAESGQDAAMEKMYPSLMALAQRHAGHPTLFEICVDLGDAAQLRTLMRESMGSKEGSFYHYVFQQYYKNEQYARLLSLGEEFPEELALFLHDHKELLWLHELFLDKLSSASCILHALAFSNNGKAGELGEEMMHDRLQGTLKPQNLEERKHALYLAKLSLLAAPGVGPEVEEKLARLDADIGILEVQERVVEAGMVGEEVLSPRQLIEACLRHRCGELVVSLFDVFGLAGEDFRRANRSLLERAWVWAADQDNWAEMKQIAEEEGWSDEHQLQFLQGTALCHASMRCYGAEAGECHGGCFVETLPLWQSGIDAGLSVESVLMRHPDFSFSGQAMLTALRLGVETHMMT